MEQSTCRSIGIAAVPAHGLHAAQRMHERRCSLKEDLDDRSKVGHAAQVQAHTAACQANGVVE